MIPIDTMRDDETDDRTGNGKSQNPADRKSRYKHEVPAPVINLVFRRSLVFGLATDATLPLGGRAAFKFWIHGGLRR